MGENSKIAWTDHTFNPWIGCARVSAECKNCYAETMDARYKFGGNVNWGKTAPRHRTGEANWRKPIVWNRQAAAEGVRRRVFCASLADVFEGRDDLDGHRADLWELVEATPWLDWLLLTKRPEEIPYRTPWGALICHACRGSASLPLGRSCRDHQPYMQLVNPPSNIWFGTSCGIAESVPAVDRLISVAKAASTLFVSAEPLLGPVDLSPHLADLDWVIAGGESGPGHRSIDAEWVKSLQSQCREAVFPVPFFFKQWGGATPDAGGHLLDGQEIREFPNRGRLGADFQG